MNCAKFDWKSAAERFVRFGSDPGEKLPGTGLGLAICRSIVALHGGCIRAVRAPTGQGLEADLILPAAAA